MTPKHTLHRLCDAYSLFQVVEKGSYADLAVAVSAANAQQQQHGGSTIIPDSVGGPAAAASKDKTHAVLQVCCQ
jgi:hypothetical protein